MIVAGFQGISEGKEITTLGRGGSDTTAVALGVALGAERVEFYKDVRGFYQSDPKKSKDSIIFPHLSLRKHFFSQSRGIHHSIFDLFYLLQKMVSPYT